MHDEGTFYKGGRIHSKEVENVFSDGVEIDPVGSILVLRELKLFLLGVLLVQKLELSLLGVFIEMRLWRQSRGIHDNKMLGAEGRPVYKGICLGVFWTGHR